MNFWKSFNFISNVYFLQLAFVTFLIVIFIIFLPFSSFSEKTNLKLQWYEENQRKTQTALVQIFNVYNLNIPFIQPTINIDGNLSIKMKSD